MEALAARIVALAAARPGRILVAIAGAPGAGKSTLAAALVDRLGPQAALVPMDGFHLDNAILDARGRRFAKGSPDTFDVAGFEAALQRLKAGGEVIVPVFDRYIDVSRGSARVVPPEARIIVAEGNYLLLRDAPWDRLHGLWDLTVFLDVPLAELERRLIARWLHHGLSDGDARRRANDNDIPNARRVIDGSLAADVVIRPDDLPGPAVPDHSPA
ncbi:MAG: nucleoside triphosphate hydrolase [Rhodobacter sp.]|nr:nucleoside triphosphate hydrolase [Rhodobacter sp.]